MSEQDPFFTPENIDEQIDLLIRDQSHAPDSPEQAAHLISHLQHYYSQSTQKPHDPVDRAWKRIIAQRQVTQQTSQSKVFSLQGKRTHTNVSHRESELSTLRSHGAIQSGKNSRRSFKRLFGTGIVAAAVLALVLSWVLVFSGGSQASSTVTDVKQATSTAQVPSPYPLFPMLAFRDPLTTGSAWGEIDYGCHVTSTGLQASMGVAEREANCMSGGTFGEMAFQVTMTITQGECGGLLFRYRDNSNYGLAYICSDGRYNVGYVVANQGWTLFPKDRPNPAIHQGLNQPNILAVTIVGNEVGVYINKQVVTGMHQAFFTGPLRQGYVGLVALDFHHATSITFTNAMVWTAN